MDKVVGILISQPNGLKENTFPPKDLEIGYLTMENMY